jgi:hypothetical protein
MYDPSTSIFAGLDTTTLQTWLTSAQTALVELQTGSKVATVSYTQGDGSKSVSYTRAEIGSLIMLIRQLQAQLGIICRPRRAMGVWF